MEQAEAAAAAEATAAAEAEKAAAHLAAEEEEEAARVRTASESTAWVASINTMVASGWEEWTSGRESTAKDASATSPGSAAAAARLEAEEARRKAAAGRKALHKAELKAWLNQHQGLLLLALLLTVWALVSHSGLLSEAPPPPPPPLKPHEKARGPTPEPCPNAGPYPSASPSRQS
jgi:hypothetical protein